MLQNLSKNAFFLPFPPGNLYWYGDDIRGLLCDLARVPGCREMLLFTTKVYFLKDVSYEIVFFGTWLSSRRRARFGHVVSVAVAVPCVQIVVDFANAALPLGGFRSAAFCGAAALSVAVPCAERFRDHRRCRFPSIILLTGGFLCRRLFFFPWASLIFL